MIKKFLIRLSLTLHQQQKNLQTRLKNWIKNSVFLVKKIYKRNNLVKIVAFCSIIPLLWICSSNPVNAHIVSTTSKKLRDQGKTTYNKLSKEFFKLHPISRLYGGETKVTCSLKNWFTYSFFGRSGEYFLPTISKFGGPIAGNITLISSAICNSLAAFEGNVLDTVYCKTFGVGHAVASFSKQLPPWEIAEHIRRSVFCIVIEASKQLAPQYTQDLLKIFVAPAAGYNSLRHGILSASNMAAKLNSTVGLGPLQYSSTEVTNLLTSVDTFPIFVERVSKFLGEDCSKKVFELINAKASNQLLRDEQGVLLKFILVLPTKPHLVRELVEVLQK